MRSGKGLVGIHAAADSYHRSTKGPEFIGMVANGVFGAADQNGDERLRELLLEHGAES